MAAPGEVLAGRYRLVQQIGAGGMATVWRARDTRLRRHVAVKLLRPELAEDADLVRRFESEARHAASLSHPNVATVYDTDVDAGRAFIVMELVDGPSVAEVIAESGPVEPHVAVEIAAAAARALAAAHRRGLIHRDVKPANLLIGRDGRVRLADFGIARALTLSRLSTPGTVLGSIPYLSPGQARGDEATMADDIFSLGIVLFEMLTGRLPWEADTPAAMATMRLNAPAPPPSAVVRSLPDGLDAIVGRALALEAEDRYPSARLFADALDGWLREARRRAGVPAESTGTLARAVPAAAAPLAAVARPNPWALPPPERGRTRRGWRPTGPAPTVAGAVAAAAATHAPAGIGAAGRTASGAEAARARAELDEASSPQTDRRASLLLALLAVGLLVAVAAAMLLPQGGRSDLGGAVPPAPTQAPVPSLEPLVTPTATPSPSPLVAPTPTLTPSPLPTVEHTVRPTAPPTPRPTPRPTPAPTVPPAAAAPGGAVVAFYDAVEAHDWETAINLWSPSMQERYPVQEWLIDRFERTTRIDITSLRTISVDQDAGTARVAVTLVEYRTVEPSPRTFTGAWDLVRLDGRWVLNDPDF